MSSVVPKTRRLSRFCLVFLAVLATTLIFALNWPITGGDWGAYGVVARNIYEGHGVSLSIAPPYKPHFGGNTFPGFPAFCALAWLIFGKTLAAAQIAQCLALALATALFCDAIDTALPNLRAGRATGLLLAFSPLFIGWPRALLTHALMMAAVMIFFALLLRGLHDKKCRPLALALAITAAVYTRSEGIFLLAPLCAFFVIRDADKKALLKRILLTGVLVCCGFGVWIARNAIVGASDILPPPMIVINKNYELFNAPRGYIFWSLTWMSKEYERGGWGFPVTTANYDKIYIPPAAYDDAAEEARVTTLLEELKKHVDGRFPESIDREFKQIAFEKIHRHPFRIFLFLPLKRFVALWLHPGSSFGLPAELNELTYEDRTALEANLFSGTASLFKKYPTQVAAKIAVFLATVFVWVFGVRGGLKLARNHETRPIAASVAFYFLALTLFYCFSNNVEARYGTTMIPLLYFLTALALSRPPNAARSLA